MNNRVLSRNVAEHIGEKITIKGWLYKKRLLGKVTFIIVRDRSGLTQVLVQKEVEIKKLHGLHNGTVVSVTGTVVKDERAPAGAEIHDPLIEIIVPAKTVPAIEVDKPIKHGPEHLETLYETRVLNLRNVTEQGIFKIQAQVGKSLRAYFEEHELIEVHTPKLLSGATEGGAEVFKLDYFGKEATLAQSPQFYKQMLVGVFERVYEIAPVYRAELSATTRHMSEYISVDGEMGFVTELKQLMDFLSGLVNRAIDDTWRNNESELVALKATKPVLTDKFPSITLKELHERYSKDSGESATIGEKDPTPAEERWVSEYARDKWGSEAIFVTEFPASDAKFYHKLNEVNPKIADRCDLIFRGVEIVTASLREHSFEKLVRQLKAINGDPKEPGFKYFLEAMQAGIPPHGGFGLGLERLTEKIIGLGNVKEAALFPRDINRLSP